MRSMPGCELVSYHMQKEHIHVVMVIPPKYAVSDVIGRLKGQTASDLRKKFAWLEKVYWNENVVWSPGYFVSTVGVEEEQILRYVAWQGRQDSGQTKFEF
jgi:putative transposase